MMRMGSGRGPSPEDELHQLFRHYPRHRTDHTALHIFDLHRELMQPNLVIPMRQHAKHRAVEREIHRLPERQTP